MSERRAEDIGMSGYLSRAELQKRDQMLARLSDDVAEAIVRAEKEGWIDHDGGDCPVDGDTRVEVRNAKGWTITADAFILVWEKVVAYRVVTA